MSPIRASIPLYITCTESFFLCRTRSFQTSVPSRSPSLTIRHFAPKTKRIRTPRANVAPPGHARPERIAVVGGGLAGLAVTYHLLNSTARFARKRGFDSESLRITIFDPAAPGEGGATAVAAGLLHWFTPRTKKKAWMPLRSMHAALKLINVAQQKVGDASLMHSPGILRLALTPKMHEDFELARGRFPKEVDVLTPSQVEDLQGEAPKNVYGALLKDGAVVDTTRYVQGLWEVCKESGRVEWRQEAITDISSLFENSSSSSIPDDRSEHRHAGGHGQFDTVVLCAGASIKGLREMRDAPLTPCRGQNLILEKHDTSNPLTVPVVCRKYLIPDYFPRSPLSTHDRRDSKDAVNNPSAAPPRPRLLAGATFEHKPAAEPEMCYLRRSDAVDQEGALSSLREPLEQLYPGLLDDWGVVGSNCGTRALPPRGERGCIPLAGQVEGTRDGNSCWMLSGLGSRGLLHHAYLGRMLAHAIVAGNERLIPGDARRVKMRMGGAEEANEAEAGVAERGADDAGGGNIERLI